MADNNNQNQNQNNQGGGRGFAGMDEQKQRDIASKGGKAAHQKGTAHQWDSEEARKAGQKGGQSKGQNQNNTESTDENM